MKTNHQTFQFDEAGQVGLYLVDNRECLINGSKEVQSGLVNNQKQKHGFGILKLDNNDLYKGEFILDDFQGVGSLDMGMGDKYFGEWKDGKVHGFGV